MGACEIERLDRGVAATDVRLEAACGIERLEGAWLAATDVRLERHVESSVYMRNGIERVHGKACFWRRGWLVLICCDATDVRLERVLVQLSVYMGKNDWL